MGQNECPAQIAQRMKALDPARDVWMARSREAWGSFAESYHRAGIAGEQDREEEAGPDHIRTSTALSCGHRELEKVRQGEDPPGVTLCGLKDQQVGASTTQKI